MSSNANATPSVGKETYKKLRKALADAEARVSGSFERLRKAVGTSSFDEGGKSVDSSIKARDEAREAFVAVTCNETESDEDVTTPQAAGGSAPPVDKRKREDSGEGAAGGSSAPASPILSYALVRGGSLAPASPTITYPLARCYTNRGLPGFPAITPPGAPVLVRPVKRPTLGNGGAGGNTGNGGAGGNTGN